MPELPEVETIRTGLVPVMRHTTINSVKLHRQTLRFPFPDSFTQRLHQRPITDIHRHGKYLLFALEPAHCLLVHLGMTGGFRVHSRTTPVSRLKHDHVVFSLNTGTDVIFNDTRRFGYMTILDGTAPENWMEQKPLSRLGPDALSCTRDDLSTRLSGRQTTIRQALLDQTVISGLGNIYVSEVLFRARVRLDRIACALVSAQHQRLATAIDSVLTEAVAKGGSSIDSYRRTDGKLGYFQHDFCVYGRADKPCQICTTPIVRVVIAGRSGFFCPSCQA